MAHLLMAELRTRRQREKMVSFVLSSVFSRWDSKNSQLRHLLVLVRFTPRYCECESITEKRFKKKTKKNARYKLKPTDWGDWVNNRLKVLGGYLFVLAGENSSCMGFMTEKIYNAFQAGAIPIYLGRFVRCVQV